MEKPSSIVRSSIKTLKKTESYYLCQSQGCLFDFLINRDLIYYYFHGWYLSNSKAYVTVYPVKILSEENLNFLSLITYDYTEKTKLKISMDDLQYLFDSDPKLSDFKEPLVGKNCTIVYRSYKDLKTPSVIEKIELLSNPKNQIFLKRNCRVPKNLLPSTIEQSKPKKTLKEILETSKSKNESKQQKTKKTLDNVIEMSKTKTFLKGRVNNE